MSSLGLFDVKGLTEIDPHFQIGSPLFDRVIIQLNRDYYPGKKFVIETRKKKDDDFYIQSVSWNNKKQHSIMIPFHSVVNGGKLKLELSGQPNLQIKN